MAPVLAHVVGWSGRITPYELSLRVNHYRKTGTDDRHLSGKLADREPAVCSMPHCDYFRIPDGPEIGLAHINRPLRQATAQANSTLS